MFGLSELAMLLIVVLIVSGAKKLPDLASNAGKAARVLKSEAKAMKAQEPPAEGPGRSPRTVQGQVVRGGPRGGGPPRP